VILVEAGKQVYAISGGRRVRKMVPKLKPALATFQAPREAPRSGGPL
jgi:hypothetical protein